MTGGRKVYLLNSQSHLANLWDSSFVSRTTFISPHRYIHMQATSHSSLTDWFLLQWRWSNVSVKHGTGSHKQRFMTTQKTGLQRQQTLRIVTCNSIQVFHLREYEILSPTNDRHTTFVYSNLHRSFNDLLSSTSINRSSWGVVSRGSYRRETLVVIA